MFVKKNFLLIVVGLAVIFAFAMKATIFQQSGSAPKPTGDVAPDFRSYWFSGKAELNSYQLQQAQYGALNPGQAVLIFVTEDFRTDKLVKSETEESRDKAVPVLKLNAVRKFVTGIYDYSLFTSVFTPINTGNGQADAFPTTLKVSTSGQEWCGHSYLQLSYKNNGYQVNGRSYFEKEVEEDYKLDKALLEDELWTRIRLAPDQLPTGNVTLIPGTATARLRHKTLEPLATKATLADYQGTIFPGQGLKTYTIEYPTDGRTLMIVFEDRFPHKIAGWEETYKSKDNLLTSRAILQKTIQTDYWNHNAPADSTLRQALAVR
ncbi:hypothetical protein DYU11_14760 [Fibrisoma montanum]|uniref:Septum formation inhibitor Maf n=1 Tax=Fibrisoma montanum TaxID=2305895 RepID=A0A418M875_9BACT|nr:hypothetical protein [Fibrisoma montanum]RIV22281.1 hypothetical protein DYU11_14760 [Fibrisoma montanum]